MAKSIPSDTVQAFARSIFAEATDYGFSQVDILRLINALMDQTTMSGLGARGDSDDTHGTSGSFHVVGFPLRSDRLQIRQADPEEDISLLESWMEDRYGRYFLLSSATAQPVDLESLLRNSSNEVGIILEDGCEPIGAVAFLDIDPVQKRAELRKLIGKPEARGKGLAEEATRLWVWYGGRALGLEKIYVSTLQTHLRNIQLNEAIGFKVEGLLQQEVRIAGERYDVLRMGLCFDEFSNLA